MNDLLILVITEFPVVGYIITGISTLTVATTIAAPITPWLWDDKVSAWLHKGAVGKVSKFIESFSLIKDARGKG